MHGSSASRVIEFCVWLSITTRAYQVVFLTTWYARVVLRNGKIIACLQKYIICTFKKYIVMVRIVSYKWCKTTKNYFTSGVRETKLVTGITAILPHPSFICTILAVCPLGYSYCKSFARSDLSQGLLKTLLLSIPTISWYPPSLSNFFLKSWLQDHWKFRRWCDGDERSGQLAKL